MTLTEIFVEKKQATPPDLLNAWRDISEIMIRPDDPNLERIRQLHLHLTRAWSQALRRVQELDAQVAELKADLKQIEELPANGHEKEQAPQEDS